MSPSQTPRLRKDQKKRQMFGPRIPSKVFSLRLSSLRQWITIMTMSTAIDLVRMRRKRGLFCILDTEA
jgi:hypothetical protein